MSKSILIGALAITLSAALWVSAAVPRTDVGPGECEDAERLAGTDPEAAAAWQVAGDRMALARWRSEEKRQTARALIHGRLTLAEATARFRELNGRDPDAIGRLADGFPSAGEEEVTCRQVLLFVRVQAAKDPAAVAALTGLEAEFVRRFPTAPSIPAV